MAKAEQKRKQEECLQRITYDYATKLKGSRLSKGGIAKVEKGYLTNLIAERIKEYDVMEKIPEVTIQKWQVQGTLVQCEERLCFVEK